MEKLFHAQEKLNKIIRNTQLPFCCARDKDSTTIRLLSIRSNGRDHDSAWVRSCAFSTWVRVAIVTKIPRQSALHETFVNTLRILMRPWQGFRNRAQCMYLSLIRNAAMTKIPHDTYFRWKRNAAITRLPLKTVIHVFVQIRNAVLIKFRSQSFCAYTFICWDYIKKYSRPIEFLYFYRPINIILSADWSDYIKDKTRRFPKSEPKLYNRPIVDRRSADTSADDKWWATIGRSLADDRPTVGRHIGRWYVAHSNMTSADLSADLSADHRPIVGRPSADCQNPKTVGRWKKNYNKVVIIYFLSADEKRAEIWHFFIGRWSADKSADGRPTVFWVNVIAV